MVLKQLLCLISAVALLCFYGCSRRISAQKDLEPRLIAAIEKGRIGDEPVIVRLKDLTTFEWDRFYEFSPYTRREEVRETLGINWDPNTSIPHQDQNDLLVFVNRGKVVHYHDHPIEHGDFNGFKRTGYVPDEAVFVVTFEEQSRLVVRPVGIKLRGAS